MTASHSTFLPPNALEGIRLGISISESPDLMRLGLVDTHLRLALAEVTRCVLVSGGRLAYGGHLSPDGYTSFVARELERYSRRDRPLRVCLAWPVHRGMSLDALELEKSRLGLYGEIACVDPDGNEINPSEGRTAGPQAPAGEEVIRQSFTGLRRYMTNTTRGRVLIGGKREEFLGKMPGVMEEALLAIREGQPIYIAGGFGGIAFDICAALGIDRGEWFPMLRATRAPDERIARGLSELVEAAKATSLESLNNGLAPEENRRLATSHRPSEIAALVSLGLGRRFLSRHSA